MGSKMHAAIVDGYEDYVKWLSWPTEIPTVECEVYEYFLDRAVHDQ